MNKNIDLFTNQFLPDGIFDFLWDIMTNNLIIKIKHITINGNNFYI